MLTAPSCVLTTTGEMVVFFGRGREGLSLTGHGMSTAIKDLIEKYRDDTRFRTFLAALHKDHPCAWREARVLPDIRPYHAHRHSPRKLPLGEGVYAAIKSVGIFRKIALPSARENQRMNLGLLSFAFRATKSDIHVLPTGHTIPKGST